MNNERNERKYAHRNVKVYCEDGMIFRGKIIDLEQNGVLHLFDNPSGKRVILSPDFWRNAEEQK